MPPERVTIITAPDRGEDALAAVKHFKLGGAVVRALTPANYVEVRTFLFRVALCHLLRSARFFTSANANGFKLLLCAMCRCWSRFSALATSCSISLWT